MNTRILSIFEEIGLAELSPFNPLKVLHSFLEHPNISFIGISNWVIKFICYYDLLEFRCFQNEQSLTFTKNKAKQRGTRGNCLKYLRRNEQR